MVELVARTVNEEYSKECSVKLPAKWWLSATGEQNFHFWIGNQ